MTIHKKSRLSVKGASEILAIYQEASKACRELYSKGLDKDDTLVVRHRFVDCGRHNLRISTALDAPSPDCPRCSGEVVMNTSKPTPPPELADLEAEYDRAFASKDPRAIADLLVLVWEHQRKAGLACDLVPLRGDDL